MQPKAVVAVNAYREADMGINGWINWFDRLSRGERRAKRQLLAYCCVLVVLAVVLVLMERAG